MTRRTLLSRFQTHPESRSAGFTIVELMIATVVFSTVLVVITVGVLRFTNSYYKGINSSATQAATQNALDAISQAIQFSSGGTTPTSVTNGIFCAGGSVFYYTLGAELMGDPSSANAGLYQMVNTTGSCPSSQPPTYTGGTELLGKNMRLASISLTGDPNSPQIPWQITVRVAYGDSDLLCSPAQNGNKGGCSGSGSTDYLPSENFAANDMTCKGISGSQFCSVTALTTTALQRIVTN